MLAVSVPEHAHVLVAAVSGTLEGGGRPTGTHKGPGYHGHQRPHGSKHLRSHAVPCGVGCNANTRQQAHARLACGQWRLLAGEA